MHMAASDVKDAETKLQSIISSNVWTPEQQLQELTRRLDIFDSIQKSWVAMTPKFNPCPDDVICVVPPKSGTTWLTHICHQIRMKGAEPDFDEQTKVVYWLDANKKKYGIDPDDVVQPAKPRLFVSNFTSYDKVPKSRRMIYVFRDAMDALYSEYRMRDSLFMLRGRVSFGVYAKLILDRGKVRQKFEDLVIWWGKRHQEDVLFLFYDDFKENHKGSVRRIAKFIRIDCDEEIIERVIRTTTHSEMSKHASKFDSVFHMPSLISQFHEEPRDGENKVGRVRKDGGKSGDGSKNLPFDIQEQINQLWKEIVTTTLGFKDLNEMRQACLRELSVQ